MLSHADLSNDMWGRDVLHRVKLNRRRGMYSLAVLDAGFSFAAFALMGCFEPYWAAPGRWAVMMGAVCVGLSLGCTAVVTCLAHRVWCSSPVDDYDLYCMQTCCCGCSDSFNADELEHRLSASWLRFQPMRWGPLDDDELGRYAMDDPVRGGVRGVK